MSRYWQFSSSKYRCTVGVLDLAKNDPGDNFSDDVLDMINTCEVIIFCNTWSRLICQYLHAISGSDADIIPSIWKTYDINEVLCISGDKSESLFIDDVVMYKNEIFSEENIQMFSRKVWNELRLTHITSGILPGNDHVHYSGPMPTEVMDVDGNWKISHRRWDVPRGGWHARPYRDEESPYEPHLID